jgi:integrase/recombinase XerD
LGLQLQRYGELLGIEGVTPHALRRAVATHLLEAGAHIVEIKKLFGHRDINSTMVYTQVFPVELMRAHGKTHPRARRHGH